MRRGEREVWQDPLGTRPPPWLPATCIAIFRTNDDGTLEKIGYTRTARHPRNFMITQDGRHLLVACRDDQVIQTFAIGKDGSLTLLPQVLRFENDKPSSITAIQR